MNLFDWLFSTKPSKSFDQSVKHPTKQEETWQFQGFQIRVIRKARRKRVSIELKPHDPVILVKASLSTPRKMIEKFLLQKQDWILKNQKRFQENKKHHLPDGQFYFLGQVQSMAEHHLTPDKLKKFYVKKAKEFLPKRIADLAAQTQLYPHKVTIRMQATRWGSCSAKGHLSINAKLMAAPLWIIDSVLLHELCHLQHMNHSKDFWSLLAKHSPHHEKADEWLNQHMGHLGSLK